jgi:RNA polymerase sigma-70 factor (ECF subfamily)
VTVERGPETRQSTTPQAPVEGSTRDFETLYQAHSQRIYQYCVSRLGNAADAEDATQEAFFRATRQLHRLVGEPAAYLTAIAHNVCYDLRRSSRHQALPLEDLSPVDDTPGPEVCAVQRSLLNRAWIRLNRQERSLLAQTYAGFSYQEIADATGLSAKAVSVGICRARKRVRQAATAAALMGAALLGRAFARLMRRTTSASGSALVSTVSSAQPAALIAAAVVVSVTAAVMVRPGGTMGEPSRAASSLKGPANDSDSLVATSATSGSAQVADRPGQAEGATSSPATSGIRADSPLTSAAQPALPSTQAEPQNTYFDTMTASPDYAHDHTVFASGWLSVGCASAECPVLFVTHDGGHTWSAIGKVGFQHGTVLLPSDFATDRIVFVASDTAGLLRSTDGGETFTTVVPLAGVAAISPTSPAGHPEVLLVPTSGGQSVIYREGVPGVSPGPSLPAQFVPSSVIFAADGRTALVGGGLLTNPAAGATAVVESCGQLGCAQVLALPGDNARVSLAEAASGRAIVASTPQHVAVSLDGGQTFSHVLTSPAQVTAVAVDDSASGPVVFVATLAGAGGRQVATLRRSTDDGQTLSAAVADIGQISVIRSILGLGGGHELAGVMSSQLGNPFGIRCSADDGTSWSSTC